MIVKEVLTKWGFVTDDKALVKTDAMIKKTDANLKSLSSTARRVGGVLSASITLPIIGLAGFMIKAASDAEETFTKFDTVFGGIKKEADAVAKNLKNNFGLSGKAAKELLSDTGDLLSGFKFSQKASLDLAKQVNELAVDLASFTNFSGGAEGASKALTKALLGERESVKSLGISILEEDVKKKVLINRNKGLTFETNRQAKAYATLQIAQEQSKNAIGDFARTSSGFANQLRILRGKLFDVAVAFGSILLPIALKIVHLISSITDKFENLSKETKTFILIVAGILAVIGPVILLVGLMTGAVISLTAAFATLGVTSLAALLPLIGTFLLWVAGISAVLLIAEDLFSFFTGGISTTGALVDAFIEKFPFMAKVIEKTLQLAKNLWTIFIDSLFEGTEALGNILSDIFSPLLAGFKGFLALLTDIPDAIGAIIDAIGITDLFKTALGIKGGTSDEGGGFDFLSILDNLIEATSSTPAVAGTPSVANNINSKRALNIKTNIEVAVPTGTPPELVAPAIQAGVENVLNTQLNDAIAAGESAVEF